MEAEKTKYIRRYIKINDLILIFVGIALIELSQTCLLELIQNKLLLISIIRLSQIVFLFFYFFKYKKDISIIGIHEKTDLVKGIIKGCIWSMGFALLAGIVFAVIFFMGFNPLKFFYINFPKDNFNLFLYFLTGGIIAPIAEEFFFRGVLYRFFGKWGVAVAIIGSTIIFAFCHGLKVPVTQVIGGIVFSVAYEIEDNLIVPIIIHCLGNLALFSLGFFF